jgi:AraC family transcriptional regulator, regulatory protein of adaptative response / DNA-3-methyladenine glycosylase II
MLWGMSTSERLATAAPTFQQLTHAQMVAAMLESDHAFDGVFIVGVRTTGIYCLPSCRPPRKPKPENVAFFATPEDAQAAGLRACKLCRPTDFYLGHHAGEQLVADLVARMRCEPGAFASVRAVTAASGIGASKLHELFRTHYHTTPAELLTRARIARARRLLLETDKQVAEIAFEVGFESLSAFNTNFRRQSALTPAAYRKLPDGCPLDLLLPVEYPLERTLRYLGRDPHSLSERVDGHTLWVSQRLGDRGVVVQVTFEPGRARCEVLPAQRLCPAQRAELHERLLALLGLTSDPARFEAQVLSDTQLAPLVEGQRGLRVPLVPDPFDGLIWAIAGQQVNLPFAYTLRRRLTERVGQPLAAGLYTPPAPQDVAMLELDDLTALSFSRAKARYLLDAARGVVAGDLPLVEMACWPATRVERSLLAMRGIGPWSAHYLMLRAYGFLDCVPLGDTGLTSGLQRFFDLPARPDKRETLALMQRFSPYRSLATFHLWQRYGKEM